MGCVTQRTMRARSCRPRKLLDYAVVPPADPVPPGGIAQERGPNPPVTREVLPAHMDRKESDFEWKMGASYPNRSALSPERSTDGVSLETSSETSLPVIGAMLTPIIACPDATIRFGQRRVRPI